MRIIIGLLIIILFFAGPIKAGAYPQSVSDWRGYKGNLLIENWGQPDIKVINANGNTVLIYHIETYRTYNRQWSPAIGVSRDGRTVITAPTNSYTNQTDLSLNCTVKFEVDRRGTVIGTQMRGEGCQSGRIHP